MSKLGEETWEPAQPAPKIHYWSGQAIYSETWLSRPVTPNRCLLHTHKIGQTHTASNTLCVYSFPAAKTIHLVGTPSKTGGTGYIMDRRVRESALRLSSQRYEEPQSLSLSIQIIKLERPAHATKVNTHTSWWINRGTFDSSLIDSVKVNSSSLVKKLLKRYTKVCECVCVP